MPHPVDRHVGAKLRSLRAARGISQTKLAKKLGRSFQQVQKYESGANRISASTLYDISRTLNVQPNYFFEGLGDGEPEAPISLEAARVAGFLVRIPDQRAKDRLYALIKAIASSSATAPQDRP